MATFKGAQIERIVSLAPSATSILIALGARSQIVGVTRWCSEVADVRGIPRLGDCWAGDAAAVLRHKPTLVIGSVPYQTKTVAELLKLPATFIATNPRSLADIFRDIRQLGRLVGKKDSGEKLVRQMGRAFSRIRRRSGSPTARLRVYSEAWPNPRISSPPWVAELVQMAGGRFVVPAGKQISNDELLDANPDVVLLAWAAVGLKSRPALLLNDYKLRNVTAIRMRQVFVVADHLLNTPGPPLIQGAREIARLLQLCRKRRSDAGRDTSGANPH